MTHEHASTRHTESPWSEDALSPILAFSVPPTSAELTRARVFAEPLVPIGVPAGSAEAEARENTALAQALLAWIELSNPEDTRPLTRFLDAYPGSIWRASLLVNIGFIQYRTGHFTEALEAWERAWRLSAPELAPPARAVADQALSELALLNAKLGRADEIESLLSEAGDRDVHGSASERLAAAREGLWMMRNRPGEAFKCGPMALGRILSGTRSSRDDLERIHVAQSTPQGLSLTQVARLAEDLKMGLQPARRRAGAPLLLPAVVHWRVGHFAAIVQTTSNVRGERIHRVEDPTFDQDLWISDAALDQESSGYFLVPSGDLPEGWEPISDAEGDRIWGRGFTSSNDPDRYGPDDDKPKPKCECRGLPQYNFHTMLVSLNIMDTPVGYSPARGPAVLFTVTYNQREPNQSAIFRHSNLGKKWTFDWFSYIEDDPSIVDKDVQLYLRGGGRELYGGYDPSTGRYAPQFASQAILVRTSDRSYERRLRDGSREIFALSDRASPSRRIFLTQIVDPRGNAVTLGYDADLRLVTATDATGRVTKLSYEHASDSLKITTVTDPFGRSASFAYDAVGRLVEITDVIGMATRFSYAADDFISAMETPYGTTTFQTGANGTNKWVTATDPLGQTERLEFRHEAPNIPARDPDPEVPAGMMLANQYLQYRNSFWWNKRAYIEANAGEASRDYRKAKITHWLHTHDGSKTSGTKESEKMPLERRVWYRYRDQTISYFEGTDALVIQMGRVLDDGRTQLHRYEYNALGRMTKSVDPVGRTTTYTYSSDGEDLLEVHQVRSSGTTDLLVSITRDAQRRPQTITDAAGQTTTFTYNANHQPLTITNALGELTAFDYDERGRLMQITRAGATHGVVYDDYDRPWKVTNPDGYAVTTEYDALDRPARTIYPDATTREITYDRLDVARVKDRLGRTTTRIHDVLRRMISIVDPMGRTLTLEWNADDELHKIMDAEGHATTWTRDLQGRPTGKVLADGTICTMAYESGTSRLRYTEDAKQQRTTYLYHVDDNIDQVTYTQAAIPTPPVVFERDPTYDRITRIQDGAGTTTYTYHPAGVLGAGQVATVDGPTPGDTMTFRYDALGRRVGRTINGSTSTIVPDALGRPVQEINALGTFTYRYEGASFSPVELLYPNGQRVIQTYFDNKGDFRPHMVINLTPSGVLQSVFACERDAEGQITRWLDLAFHSGLWSRLARWVARALVSLHLTDLLADRIEYDAAGQVVRYAERFGGGDHLYMYDRAGNRLVERIRQSGVAFRYNAVNELIAREEGGIARIFTYDENGNTTSDGVRAFEWDAANRLSAITSGTHRSEFVYDWQGRRVRVVERDGGVVTSDRRYLWDGAEIVEERETTPGTSTRRFFDHGVQEDGAAYFFTRDLLGSVRELTTASGAVVGSWCYDPWGRPKRLSGAKDAALGYGGYWNHAPSGLSLTWHRAYDPELGRWISRDPLGEEDDVNLYRYVRNSPVNLTDPLGLGCPMGTSLQWWHFNRNLDNRCPKRPPPECPGDERAWSRIPLVGEAWRGSDGSECIYDSSGNLELGKETFNFGPDPFTMTHLFCDFLAAILSGHSGNTPGQAQPVPCRPPDVPVPDRPPCSSCK
ncbi:RHS repeat-associated core domain-containing protein [Sorangium sp. So ce260]|uniref:RHS repeat-associated core domain-containing protein n=1 Tax=Sorangium sp. So ce260 TaxID=3133291 RepID=UPI003F63910C